MKLHNRPSKPMYAIINIAEMNRQYLILNGGCIFKGNIALAYSRLFLMMILSCPLDTPGLEHIMAFWDVSADVLGLQE